MPSKVKPIYSNLPCSSFTVQVEMACNGMFGAGDNGMIAPPDMERQFTLACCEIVVFDRRVYNLIRDVELLHDIAKVFTTVTSISSLGPFHGDKHVEGLVQNYHYN